MKLAIMQPYFFPYIGYFQLINAVDTFVIYDSVQFIKQGWVNRNRVLAQGREQLITVPVRRDSKDTTIDRKQIAGDRWVLQRKKLLKQIQQAYARAPFFGDVYPLIEGSLRCEETGLSPFVCHCLRAVVDYLGITTRFILSSKLKIDGNLTGQEKVLAICQSLGATHYINAIGGTDLYRCEDFVARGIVLSFIKSGNIEYRQFGGAFVPWLSIIDVMMFNSSEEIQSMLGMYELVSAAQ